MSAAQLESRAGYIRFRWCFAGLVPATHPRRFRKSNFETLPERSRC